MLTQSILSGLSPGTWVSIAVLVVGLLTLGVVSYEFYLNHLRKKQSGIQIEQMNTTDSTMRHGDSRGFFRFDMMATNEGERDGRIAKRGVLLSAVFYGESGEKTITSSDCGGGRVQTSFPTKDERRVEPGESVPLRIEVRFPDNKGISEMVTDYDKATFNMAVDIEDTERTYTLEIMDDIEFSEVTWRP